MRMLHPGDAGRSIVLLAGIFFFAALSACGPQHRTEASAAQVPCSTAAAASAQAESGPSAAPDAPFDIRVVRAVVFDAGAVPAKETAASTPGETAASSDAADPERPVKQLRLEIEINNRTDQTFEQVHYSLRLNTESEPFDVNSLVGHGSEGVFRVVPRQADLPDAPDGGVITVRGFAHGWTISISSSPDSADDCERAFARLPDTLRSVTVDINWDGGSQRETIPVHVQMS